LVTPSPKAVPSDGVSRLTNALPFVEHTMHKCCTAPYFSEFVLTVVTELLQVVFSSADLNCVYSYLRCTFDLYFSKFETLVLLFSAKWVALTELRVLTNN